MKYSVTTPKFVLPALGLALLCPVVARAAAIEYVTAGSTHSEDFDSLASSGTGHTWTNGTTLTGWHWLGEGGTTPSSYTATTAGVAVGNQILSLGSANSDNGADPSDRAFGGQNGNNIATLYYGAQILNSTGDTLDTFTLTYTGEQWRRIQNETNDRLTFQYQIFDAGEGSLSGTTGWISVEDLTFIAPATSSQASTGLDGNLEANRVESIGATVSGFTWSEGQEIWLRWADKNPVNNNALGGSTRAAMGIDDVEFSATIAIPEPSSFAVVFGALSLGFASLRRRRTGPAKATDC